jgi:dephospho-CoA kinase
VRIAVTGGIGSGKSTACAMLGELGALVIDSDAIARELTAPGGRALAAIAARWGAGVIAADGSVDRARLRAIAFADPLERAALEGILHPRIREEADARAREGAAPGQAVVFDIPLLAETQAERLPGPFDRVVVIDCPPALQFARALARATMGEADLRAAIAAQASRAQRLALATDVIVNDGSLEDLRARVQRLFVDLGKKARSEGT